MQGEFACGNGGVEGVTVITRKLPPRFPDLLFEFADLLILFLPADRSYHGQESLVARTHRETFGRIEPV